MTSSGRTNCAEVGNGRLRRSEAFDSRLRSLPAGLVAPHCCYTLVGVSARQGERPTRSVSVVPSSVTTGCAGQAG
jgi:hypothetical protein